MKNTCWSGLSLGMTEHEIVEPGSPLVLYPCLSYDELMAAASQGHGKSYSSWLMVLLGFCIK